MKFDAKVHRFYKIDKIFFSIKKKIIYLQNDNEWLAKDSTIMNNIKNQCFIHYCGNEQVSDILHNAVVRKHITIIQR